MKWLRCSGPKTLKVVFTCNCGGEPETPESKKLREEASAERKKIREKKKDLAKTNNSFLSKILEISL